MPDTFWTTLLYYIPYKVPFWLICVAGIIFSIRSWQKAQKKALFALIAFTIFLLGAIGVFLADTWLMSSYSTSDFGASQFVAYQDAVSCVSLLVQISAWVILLIALFGRSTNVSAENQPLAVVSQHNGFGDNQKNESMQDLH